MNEYCPDCGGLLTQKSPESKICSKCGRLWMQYYYSGWYAVGIYDTYMVTSQQWVEYQNNYRKEPEISK